MSMDMRIVQTIIVVSLWISIVGIVLIYGLHFRSELMIYVFRSMLKIKISRSI